MLVYSSIYEFNSSLIIYRFYFFKYYDLLIVVSKIYEKERILWTLETFRLEGGQKLSIRVTPTMNDLWLSSADTVRLTIQFIVTDRATTLKLASLFASQALAKLLIGNTRKWIRWIIDLLVVCIFLQNKFHAARKVDKVTSEWNVIDHSQTMVYN